MHRCKRLSMLLCPIHVLLSVWCLLRVVFIFILSHIHSLFPAALMLGSLLETGLVLSAPSFDLPKPGPKRIGPGPGYVFLSPLKYVDPHKT